MSEKPLITIGITCFNAADSIEKAIASALQQTWPDIEIIIIDDGSSDSSIEILQNISSRDNRIRLIQHETNKGFPTALNTIFQNAQGQFVALFDDDDQSMPERLEKQYRRICDYEAKAGTEDVFCYTNREVYNSNQEDQAAYHLKAIGRQAPEPHGPMVADYLLWSTGEKNFTWGMFGSCTLMMRPELIQKLGGFDEDFRRCAEWDLAIRGAFEGVHFIAVDEYLVQQTKTRTIDKSAKVPLHYALKLREKHKDYLKQKGWGHYYGSICLARARFFGSKGKKLPSYFFRVLNGLLTLHI